MPTSRAASNWPTAGTLFLDEISELDYSLQSKLLQVLQDGQFCRIGAQEDKKVEVRMVCATNRNLEREVEVGRFRQDLFYRINVVNIQMPALRERAADIPVLVQYFLDLYNEKYNARARPLSAQLLSQLQRYHWPGNIRELENLMRRYAILGTEEAITSELVARKQEMFDDDIPLDGPISLKKVTRAAVLELERKIILKVLQANHWNRKRAARALSISYRALLYKIRDVGLPAVRGRGRAEPPRRLSATTPTSFKSFLFAHAASPIRGEAAFFLRTLACDGLAEVAALPVRG